MTGCSSCNFNFPYLRRILPFPHIHQARLINRKRDFVRCVLPPPLRPSWKGAEPYPACMNITCGLCFRGSNIADGTGVFGTILPQKFAEESLILVLRSCVAAAGLGGERIQHGKGVMLSSVGHKQMVMIKARHRVHPHVMFCQRGGDPGQKAHCFE